MTPSTATLASMWRLDNTTRRRDDCWRKPNRGLPLGRPAVAVVPAAVLSAAPAPASVNAPPMVALLLNARRSLPMAFRSLLSALRMAWTLSVAGVGSTNPTTSVMNNMLKPMNIHEAPTKSYGWSITTAASKAHSSRKDRQNDWMMPMSMRHARRYHAMKP